MSYSIGDKVRLTSARGGWEGYVADVVGGPVDVAYVVTSPNQGDLDEGTQTVLPDGIAAGPLTLPVYSVGDRVSLYGMGGEVTSASPPEYTVEIDWYPNQHMTLTRTHNVHAWQIAVEN